MMIMMMRCLEIWFVSVSVELSKWQGRQEIIDERYGPRCIACMVIVVWRGCGGGNKVVEKWKEGPYWFGLAGNGILKNEPKIFLKIWYIHNLTLLKKGRVRTVLHCAISMSNLNTFIFFVGKWWNG